MKSFKALFVSLAAAIVFSAGVSVAEAAKPEDIFTFKDGTWHVKSGKKTEEFDGLRGTEYVNPEENTIAAEWCLINPYDYEDKNNDEARSLPIGVLLYRPDMEDAGTPYVFLTLEEETMAVDSVYIGKNNVAVASRGESVEVLSLFDLEILEMEWDGGPLERYKTLLASGDAILWLDMREADGGDSPIYTGIAFTLADEEVERPEEAGLFGATAAIYCPPQGVERVNDGLIILKKATKKENFDVTGVDEDGTQITLTRTFVKSEKDWEDSDKWQEEYVKVKVPPVAEEKIPE
jgi:hypothetical protein